PQAEHNRDARRPRRVDVDKRSGRVAGIEIGVDGRHGRRNIPLSQGSPLEGGEVPQVNDTQDAPTASTTAERGRAILSTDGRAASVRSTRAEMITPAPRAPSAASQKTS